MTEALPPLPTELLTDVAEALNQLEEDHAQVDRTKQLERAVKNFETTMPDVYRHTYSPASQGLRQAQTGFDWLATITLAGFLHRCRAGEGDGAS